MKIDVAVMTRNSDRFLEACLSHIEKAVDINRLIVVDGGSTDATLKIARSHGATILSDRGRGLGYARELAIRAVETPWFAFVDSDVMLPASWHWEIQLYVEKDVGAVESPALIKPLKGEEDVAFLHNRALKMRYGGTRELRGPQARGFTGATLLNTRAVKDVNMPRIPCCEDWVLLQHVTAKGFRWLKTPIWVEHRDRFSERPRRIRQTHAVGRLLGYMTLPWLLRKIAVSLVYRALTSILFMKPRYLLHRLAYTRNALEGWLHPGRYLDMNYPGWEGE